MIGDPFEFGAAQLITTLPPETVVVGGVATGAAAQSVVSEVETLPYPYALRASTLNSYVEPAIRSITK